MYMYIDMYTHGVCFSLSLSLSLCLSGSIYTCTYTNTYKCCVYIHIIRMYISIYIYVHIDVQVSNWHFAASIVISAAAEGSNMGWFRPALAREHIRHRTPLSRFVPAGHFPGQPR